MPKDVRQQKRKAAISKPLSRVRQAARKKRSEKAASSSEWGQQLDLFTKTEKRLGLSSLWKLGVTKVTKLLQWLKGVVS